MPIYAYRCEACGFSKDVLQKVSDAPLSECPSCAKSTFKKQLTAAGFQLKGTGWYATDFRGGGKPAAAPAHAPDCPAGTAPAAGAGASTAASSGTASDTSTSATPAADGAKGGASSNA